MGKNLPAEAVDLDRVLLYVIHIMDAIVDQKYTVGDYRLVGYTDRL